MRTAFARSAVQEAEATASCAAALEDLLLRMGFSSLLRAASRRITHRSSQFAVYAAWSLIQDHLEFITGYREGYTYSVNNSMLTERCSSWPHAKRHPHVEVRALEFQTQRLGSVVGAVDRFSDPTAKTLLMLDGSLDIAKNMRWKRQRKERR